LSDRLDPKVFAQFVGRQVDEVVEELHVLGNFPIIRKVEEGSMSTSDYRLDRLRVYYRRIDNVVTRVIHG
jgi:hypothetical protein